MCKSLRFSGVSVPRDYEQGFQRALWTFQHQRVWCPNSRQLMHLRPLPPGGLSAGIPVCCPPPPLPPSTSAVSLWPTDTRHTCKPSSVHMYRAHPGFYFSRCLQIGCLLTRLYTAAVLLHWLQICPSVCLMSVHTHLCAPPRPPALPAPPSPFLPADDLSVQDVYRLRSF